MIFTPWTHQARSVEQVLDAIHNGARRICLTSPTGTGKSRMMRMLVERYLESDLKVIIYTNRKMLLEQTSTVFGGIDFGVRAAGHTDERWKDLQISSIQTEISRLKNPDKYRGWKLHQADLVIVDEAHVQIGAEVRDILTRHVEDGSPIVGFTATPIDLGQVYDQLIVGCTMSEGRACGALVPAWIYGPDEPDLRRMGVKLKGSEFTEGQAKKALMTTTIFGRVWEWWNRLNPDHGPTIGFAPGVPESLYFAQEFWRRGVSSAHIDGTEVWINGERQYTSQSARDDILAAHREGRIKVIWNRFVMREGIDMPWATHLILATIFGSLSGFLQTAGRGLRSSPGKMLCRIQDHGGNWWRHGSPNADREWFLDYTDAMINGLREEMLRKAGAAKEPVRCPECALILSSRVCQCGYQSNRQTWPRPVVQLDGSLKQIDATLYRKRSIDTRDGAKENWIKCYWRAFKSKNGMNFRSAMALYQAENSWQYPDPNWPFMPIETVDFFRKVSEVPRSRLRS